MTTAPSPSPVVITARAELTPEPRLSLVPVSLLDRLSPEQQAGVALAIEALSYCGGFILADGTGVGKTRQQLAIARYFLDLGRKVVIISPAEVIKPNWETGRFGGSYADDGKLLGVPIKLQTCRVAPGVVNLTTYERLTAGYGALVDRDTILVFDESHYLKNTDKDTQRAAAGVAAASAALGVVFASATPADRPTNLLYMARAGVYEGKSRDQALRDLGLVGHLRTVKVKDGHKRTATGRQAYRDERQMVWMVDHHKYGDGAHAYVCDRMSDLFDRLTAQGLMVKRELSMEGVGVDLVQIALPPVAFETMDKLIAAYTGRGGSLESVPPLKRVLLMMSLRRQQETFKVDQAVRLALEELRAGRQVAVYCERVNESTDTPSKVSSAGTAVLLREAFAAAGVTDVVDLHGGAAKGEQIAGMVRFQSGAARVVVATPKSGGTGVNLDDWEGDSPRTCYVLTPPFTAAELVQTAGRFWRLSSRSKPKIVFMFGDTEIDTWNIGICNAKFDALHAIVGGDVKHLDVRGADQYDNQSYFEVLQRYQTRRKAERTGVPPPPAPQRKPGAAVAAGGACGGKSPMGKPGPVDAATLDADLTAALAESETLPAVLARPLPPGVTMWVDEKYGTLNVRFPYGKPTMAEFVRIKDTLRGTHRFWWHAQGKMWVAPKKLDLAEAAGIVRRVMGGK